MKIDRFEQNIQGGLTMFDSIEDALNDLKQGKPVIVVDDEKRENEGDLIALVDQVTPELINFMITHARGLVCTTITETLAQKLNLNLMTQNNTDPLGTAFTVSIDHKDTTTGISAYERAKTIKALANHDSIGEDFKRPGHVFPLIGKDGGVLTREGHTEASIDLASLCNAQSSGVICEIIKEDGMMARLPELEQMADEFDLKLISIEELVAYRKLTEDLVKREAETTLPTEQYGSFQVFGYSNVLDDKEHIALVKGDVNTNQPVYVRIHSKCLTGDVFGSRKCDCGSQLNNALEKINQEQAGILIYLQQEGRGIGLINKLKAYSLQEQGMDTLEANEALGFPGDSRQYTVAAHILKDLGVRDIKLLTNNPDKISAMKDLGINISERVPHYTMVHNENKAYIETKIEKFGHLSY